MQNEDDQTEEEKETDKLSFLFNKDLIFIRHVPAISFPSCLFLTFPFPCPIDSHAATFSRADPCSFLYSFLPVLFPKLFSSFPSSFFLLSLYIYNFSFTSFSSSVQLLATSFQLILPSFFLSSSSRHTKFPSLFPFFSSNSLYVSFVSSFLSFSVFCFLPPSNFSSLLSSPRSPTQHFPKLLISPISSVCPSLPSHLPSLLQSRSLFKEAISPSLPPS